MLGLGHALFKTRQNGVPVFCPHIQYFHDLKLWRDLFQGLRECLRVVSRVVQGEPALIGAVADNERHAPVQVYRRRDEWSEVEGESQNDKVPNDSQDRPLSHRRPPVFVIAATRRLVC